MECFQITVLKVLKIINRSNHAPKRLFVINDREIEFGELIKIIT